MRKTILEMSVEIIVLISHQSEWLLSKSLQAINAGEGVEKRELSYTVGGNPEYNSYYGEQWRFLNRTAL